MADSLNTELRPPISWTWASLSATISLALNQSTISCIGLAETSNASIRKARNNSPLGCISKEVGFVDKA